MFADSVAPNREDTAPARHDLALGVVVAATICSLTAGAASAKLLHDARPELAVFFAPVLGLALYTLIRIGTHATANLSLRVSVGSAAVCFVTLYFVVLAGETFRPIVTPSHLERLGIALILLARVAGAASVAILIAVVAAWRDLRGQQTVRFSASAPLVIPAAMAASAFVISMSVFMAVVALVPRPASLYLLVLMLLVLPLASRLVWTYLHVQIVSNWEVSVVPERLTSALADLQRRCGFRFDRAICLDAGYGNGRIAAVSSSPRTATLLISEPLVEMLDRNELLAVLAHEAAHVELHHVRRTLLFGLAATATVLSAGFVLWVGLSAFMPQEVVAIVLSGGLVGVGRQFYDTSVTRRHEREADEYAARAVGATALLSALEKLGAGGRVVTVANRWTTHSTWEVRSERLRQLGDEGPGKPPGPSTTWS